MLTDEWWEVTPVVRHDKELRDGIYCDKAFFSPKLWTDLVKELSKRNVSEYELVIKILINFKRSVRAFWTLNIINWY